MLCPLTIDDQFYSGLGLRFVSFSQAWESWGRDT